MDYIYLLHMAARAIHSPATSAPSSIVLFLTWARCAGCSSRAAEECSALSPTSLRLALTNDGCQYQAIAGWLKIERLVQVLDGEPSFFLPLWQAETADRTPSPPPQASPDKDHVPTPTNRAVELLTAFTADGRCRPLAFVLTAAQAGDAPASTDLPLTAAQWARIEPLLPDRTPKRGGRWRDHREVIDAIAWKFQTGSQWVHLPEKYGDWRGVYNRLRMWAIDGTWERVFPALMAQADADEELNWAVSVDSTIVRAHQHAAGARKRGPRPGSRTTMPSAGPGAD